MLDETHQEQRLDPRDDTQYTLGSIRDHNVVVACLSAGQIGIGAAASLATRMSAKFPSLRFGLMVGIAGRCTRRCSIRYQIRRCCCESAICGSWRNNTVRPWEILTRRFQTYPVLDSSTLPHSPSSRRL
ncbi:uncharacterized protein A1O5_08522 [Cladophialophora psammophila CBS 110553]|uniref:Uncharacterized protein n=1 Tax=Cladophialophora psammophila CBS 110553 TaxID=1182543 RepID=W9WLD1_9EURO|nr:uncharacterized protein A1O5_08522 [Cladophialophora psammophila CBS 110553]EXJ68728.1 hypothetical protein A1O5_08522 [Cladophialophora psammophila CBS 110553]